MSDFTVGIIAEGPTDIDIIEGIIRTAFPRRSFVFHAISPTQDEISTGRKEEGFGWGGVYRVCKGLGKRLFLQRLMGITYDALIIHVDGDVAFKRYTDIGEVPAVLDLPCSAEGDRPEDSCARLSTVVSGWTGAGSISFLPCIPFICTETWVGNWLFPENWKDIGEDTPEADVYARLLQLGRKKAEKNTRRLLMQRGKTVKKVTGNYQYAAEYLDRAAWEDTKTKYRQAGIFDAGLRQALKS